MESVERGTVEKVEEINLLSAKSLLVLLLYSSASALASLMSAEPNNKRPASDLDADSPAAKDGDASTVTIRSLFAMRTDALGLINAGDIDSNEEARKLLDRLLGHVEKLLDMLPSEMLEEGFLELEELEEDIQASCEAAGMKDSFALSYLYFLKGFALQETALLLDRTPSSSSPAPKKAKLDTEASESPSQLLEEALNAYEAALPPLNNQPDPDIWNLMLIGSLIKAQADSGAVALKNGDAVNLKARMGTDVVSFLLGQGLELLSDIPQDPFAEDSFLIEFGDPATAFIDGISAFISLLRSATGKDAAGGKEALAKLLEKKRSRALEEINEQLTVQVEALDNLLADWSEELQSMGHGWKLSLSVAAAQGHTASYEILAADARERNLQSLYDAAWPAFESGELFRPPSFAQLRCSQLTLFALLQPPNHFARV